MRDGSTSDLRILSRTKNITFPSPFSSGTPPRSPPPFSKHESRFEREQRIRVGPVDSYKPGTAGSLLDDDRDW